MTSNVKDFPSAKVPPGIDIVGPAEFAANTVAVAPDLALRAVVELTKRFKAPPLSVDEFLEILRDRYNMHEAIELITEVR